MEEDLKEKEGSFGLSDSEIQSTEGDVSKVTKRQPKQLLSIWVHRIEPNFWGK